MYLDSESERGWSDDRAECNFTVDFVGQVPALKKQEKKMVKRRETPMLHAMGVSSICILRSHADALWL